MGKGKGKGTNKVYFCFFVQRRQGRPPQAVDYLLILKIN